MRIGAWWERERRQFRLLRRDAARRLLNAAVFAPDGDSDGFAIWMLALVATPPAFYAMYRMLAYATLRHLPIEVVERIVLADRLFFITYAMLAAMLLASLLWEALFPDRAEQEIVGVLPVRARTHAAARLAAALHLGLLFAAAVSVPPAVIYTLGAASHPALRAMHRLFAGHLIGALGGCLFVLLALLAMRGAIAAIFGARAGRSIASLLQLTSIVSLVEAVFFLPGMLDMLVRAMQHGSSAAALPPVWYAALYSWVAGDGWMGTDHAAAIRDPAAFAVAALAGVGLLVAPLYLCSAARVGRGLIEMRERNGGQPLAMLARRLSTLARCQPRVGGLLMFALASLARSRAHALILSGYLGLAIAFGIFSLLVKDFDEGALSLATPSTPILALPLVLIFFLVFGLIAAFRVPTDVGANWTIRLRPPRAVDCAQAAWWTLVIVGVAPVVSALLAVAVWLWPLSTAVSIAALTFLSGVVLVELVLVGWTVVPFACEHVPAADTMKWKWIGFLVGLNVFAFQNASIELLVLGSLPGILSYAGVLAAVATIARVLRHRSLRLRPAAFADTRGDVVATLSLSEALH